ELENKLAHFPTAREGSPFARVTDREFQQVISKLSGVVSTDRHHPGTLADMELDVKDVLKRLTEMEREGGHDESGEHDARLDVLFERMERSIINVSIVIEDVIGIISVWIAEAELPPLNPSEPCGMSLFPACSWQPSSLSLTRVPAAERP